jgi:hypothetical protein
VPEGAEGLLTLQILSRQSSTPGGVDPGAGAVLACAATSPWDGVQNGRGDQGPTYDCSSAATGQLNGDQLVFELPSGLVNDSLTYDLVLVPTGTQPYTMGIEHPTDTSMLITNADELAPSSDFAASDDFSTFEDPLTSFDESFSDFGADVSADFAGDFSSPDTFATSGLGRGGARSPQLAVPAASLRNPFRPDASRGERVLAMTLLMAIGAALWWFGGQQQRLPRLLGSLGGGTAVEVTAAAPLGGIGRFARPRGTGRAPRLF